MEASTCNGEAVDLSTSDSFDREELQETSDVDHRPSRAKRQKVSLEDKILNFIKMFPCTPINDICNLLPWVEQTDLRFIRRKNDKYQNALEVFSLSIMHYTIRDFKEMYLSPKCQPVFAARKEVSEYYLDKEDTLKYCSKLIDFQHGENGKEFLTNLVNVVDRRVPKLNTFQVTSPPSAGKTWFFDMVCNFFLNRGNLKNFNRFSGFPFQDCHLRRILLWNEPNATPDSIDTLKMIFGGDDCAAGKKYEGDVNITRTPLIITTNTPFYPRIEALNHRRYSYTWEAAPFLKDVTKKPHPLYFPDLLDKYNVEY